MSLFKLFDYYANIDKSFGLPEYPEIYLIRTLVSFSDESFRITYFFSAGNEIHCFSYVKMNNSKINLTIIQYNFRV